MMQATVITPLLHGSRAVELGNRQWRKRILPIGDVEYQGRTLHFTRSYLSDLVTAWKDGAYDQVPFQLATDRNEHTNDPERTRGQIRDLELSDDGLYALLDPTDRGEQVLADNPYLGVSARIVENYQRSDGKFYPRAIQHVLGTLDPRIPQLGAWQPVDMSNSGGLIIDLSSASWAGEPGPSFELAVSAVGARLGGLDQLNDQELADLGDALAEADAEDAYGELEHFNEAFTANWEAEQAQAQAREQARQQADYDDAVRPARTDEQIMARALTHAKAGIYDTSRAASFATPSADAIELATRATVATGEGLCGSPDAYGRCSARYHDSRCIHAVSTDWQASEPPPGTYETALSNFAAGHDLGPVPVTYGGDPDSSGYPIPQRTLDFARSLNKSWGLHGDTGHRSPAPDFDELTDVSPSYGGDPYAALASELGRPDLYPQPPQGRDYPDVSGWRARMGI